MKRFAVHPGWVVSRTDGQEHYVSYSRLVALYELDPQQCVQWDALDPTTFRGRRREDYTHLFVSWAGNYGRVAALAKADGEEG